jgi:PLP dependent protein
MPTIVDRVAEVRNRLKAACERSGRHPSEVTLVAASKTRSVSEMLEACAAGVGDFGENYVQELLAKREAIDKAASGCVSWHIIGHLQRKKVKLLRPAPALIHSLDSLALAEEIDRRAAEAGERQAVLIEVNVGGEETKSGVTPAEARTLSQAVLELPHLQLQGLMAMPPYSEDPEASRPHLRRLRELALELAGELPPGGMQHLSMGMSGDWEVAVEEGATLIRLGTALFGSRA